MELYTLGVTTIGLLEKVPCHGTSGSDKPDEASCLGNPHPIEHFRLRYQFY